MKQTFFYILLLIFILPSGVSYGATITWIDINYPSAYFLEGKNKDKGFAQIGRQFLMNSIEEFDHKVQIIGVNRFLSYVKNQQSIHCTIVGVEVDQYASTVYSNVAAITPPAGIVIRAKDKTTFSSSDTVSFQSIIDQSDRIGGVINNGHYGKFFNLIISNNLDKGKIHRRNLVDPLGLYKMLILNRIDYVIEHPFSYDIQRLRLPTEQSNSLVFMPINEQIKPTYGRVLCNKNETSIKLMNLINQLISKIEYKKQLSESISTFLPEEIRAQYYDLNMEFIGKDIQ